MTEGGREGGKEGGGDGDEVGWWTRCVWGPLVLPGSPHHSDPPPAGSQDPSLSSAATSWGAARPRDIRDENLS